MMDLKGLEEFRMEQDNFCLQLWNMIWYEGEV